MQFSYSVRSQPYFGEVVCGDGNFVLETDDGLFVAIIDSLGHGASAASLSRQLEASIEQLCSYDLPWLLEELNRRFAGSIGAAITLFVLDRQRKTLHSVGVGNTLVRSLGSVSTRFEAQPGVLGERLPTLKPVKAQYADGDLFILTTDGIQERFSLTDCPELAYGTAQQVANAVIERYSKRHDDATVIVIRCRDEEDS